MTAIVPPPNFFGPVLDGNRFIATWQRWLSALQQVATSGAINSGTFSAAGMAGVAGSMFFVGSPYFHLMISDGTNWQFADGGNNFIADRPAATNLNGWQVCDGTTINYLVAGTPALSIASFTTPNLKANPSVVLSGTAYTGAINPATAPIFTGTPASSDVGSTGGGLTGVEFPYTPAGTIDTSGKMQNIVIPKYFRL